MRLLRKPTIVETITFMGVAAVLAALILIPDSATSTRWELERRVRDWQQTSVPGPDDSSLIPTELDLAGEWTNEHRLTRSSFVFTKRSQQEYDALFATSGCLGGCRLPRVASVNKGAVTLNEPVAEYMPRTYNVLYAIRIGEADYLVPADGIREFERERTSGSDGWKWYVFSRRDESNEPCVRREASGLPLVKPNHGLGPRQHQRSVTTKLKRTSVR